MMIWVRAIPIHVTLRLLLLIVNVVALCAHAQVLSGSTGASSQWGSGWMNLAPPVDFTKGDRLRLRIGGTAQRIVIRLLPRGSSPDTPVGVTGGPVDVPKTRVVEIMLTQDHKQIVQISVHGGPNPWDMFPLGGANGPAGLISVERVKP